LLASLLIANAGAATLDVTPTAVVVLNADDFAPVDPQFVVSHDALAGVVLVPRPAPYLFQVDVTVRIADLAPPEHVGFGNTAFDIVLVDAIAQSSMLPGWQAATWWGNLTNCSCGPGPNVPRWADNGDFGPDGGDLRDIILGVQPRDFGPPDRDPRWTLCQGPAGEYAGSVYLEMPGTAGPRGALDLVVRQFSTYDDDQWLNVDVDGTFRGGHLEFVVVPEPGAIAVAVACMAALGAARLRNGR
jgi:hypothetical protein